MTLSKIKQSQVTKSLDEKLFEKNKKPKEKIIKINKDSKGKHQEKTNQKKKTTMKMLKGYTVIDNCYVV